MRKYGIIGSGMLLFLMLGASKCNFDKVPDKKESSPNLVIVMADQWHGQALGFLNEDPVLTPHLDSFSNHSMVLKNFITNYPVCSPSRAMMMSGQYPFVNHVYGNCRTYGPIDNYSTYHIELSDQTVTWSDILKDKGYSLGYIGKWHLTAPYEPFIPTYNNDGPQKWNEWTRPESRHGFDYWYSYGTYDRHLRPMYWDTDAKRDDFHYVDEWEPEHDVDKAIEFLENKDGSYRKSGAPFGLVVSMNPPHTIYKDVPEKYYDIYKNISIDSLIRDPDIPAAGTKMGDAYREDIKYYYAAVTGDDEQIGRLFRALNKDNLLDNTIVLFVSDHGNNLGKHYEITKNNLYEESLRVPFMIYWKDHIAAKIDENALMSMVDVFPTLLDLMGFKSDIPKDVQGKSYAKVLLGKGKEDNAPQFFMGNVQAPDSSGGFRGVRTDEFKLAYNKKKDGNLEKYLFNYKEDPFELRNLYSDSLSIVRELDKELKTYLILSRDPFIRNFK